jgi:hypothetical protein
MNLDRVRIKRLARQIRDRHCDDIPLAKATDILAAESLRSFLESVGAVTALEVAEPGADPDRRQP